jgi:hypothetical protein
VSGDLRAMLSEIQVDEGCTLDDLTVLSPANDPFRTSEACRRDGEWLAAHVSDLIGSRRIHLRGLHYVLVTASVVKPDGVVYRNVNADWLWMSEKAAKAARWCGLLPFAQIFDARNAEPVVRRREFYEPEAYIHAYASIDVSVSEPSVMLLESSEGEQGEQRYRLVIVGEKTSLDDVLAPVAHRFEADLYLPTGEISDTFCWQIARDAVRDGRPLIVFYFTDCDPAGWQMKISVSRKLQALQAIEFPELVFEVRPVALTPDQVRLYGLPSTPLKDTEKRAPGWIEAFSVEQTEIDALAALEPRLLREIATEALEPFFDESLAERTAQARDEWIRTAQVALNEQLDPRVGELLAQAREVADQVASLRAVNEDLQAAVGNIEDYEMPPIVIPVPVYPSDPGRPLISSDWSWLEQTRRLKAAKRYE